ncbi:SIS domain-containing protein [Candidatus Bathyarchaeota archaeon]|nr:SIS domain-containing protein [Candidatus Bathyarchaeota archaeon]
MEMDSRAREILEIQKTAINDLEITGAMEDAIEHLASAGNSGRRVITTGMGKAGIIATKMSATLASLGIPSFFVSPAEAGHGDLGRICPGDLIIVFSNSGSTGEVLSMITNLHDLNGGGNHVITIGSKDDPEIPHDLAISYGQLEESCVVKRVPSTSTTLLLVIADILAITAAESLGLDDSWFKARHPGGSIGKSYREQEK